MEETFNPAALSRSDTITSTVSSTKPTTTASTKQSKAAQSYPRIDFEPLYTDLKALIGHDWGTYHDGLTRFIRGELCANEFGDLTDHFVLASPATEHAHNNLICAIIYNTGRDSPEPGPAAWVSAASDKTGGSSLSSKPMATSDAGEQRLKTEVMALPARDRRRVKAAVSDKTEEEAAATRRNAYEDYYLVSRIRAPDTVPASAGGLTKTNWELEIRKRYAQSLFAENLEFPDPSTIYARMVPICYEEAVAAGSSMFCAELVGIAAEIYVKDFLSNVFDRTRANGPRYDNGSAGGGILTAAYKRQLAREEKEIKYGKLHRNREDDLLPIESKEANMRKPIALADLQLASKVGFHLWNGMPLIGAQVMEAIVDIDQDEWLSEHENHPVTNGVLHIPEDAMDIEDDDYGWEGTGFGDREALNSLLDNCLSIRG